MVLDWRDGSVEEAAGTDAVVAVEEDGEVLAETSVPDGGIAVVSVGRLDEATAGTVA
jgi:hypothetical protein